MKLSAAGRAALEHEEGCKLSAYQDSRGRWTIGTGHTGPEVVRGLVWTQAQADAALAADIAWAENAVGKVTNLTQNQFDALVSFTFNEGAGAFAGSTLRKLLVAGLPLAAAEEFTKWTKAGDDKYALLGRRTRELIRFCKG